MSIGGKRRAARQWYDAGLALFLEGKYEQALFELRRAEDAFRAIDARGHPLNDPLPNGVSGLANTLALMGRCCRELGDFSRALVYFETCLINAKFERKRPFRAFLKTIQEHILACYEKDSEEIGSLTLDNLLSSDPAVDAKYRFPFSLTREGLTIARLYELAPKRYQHYADFFRRAAKKDSDIRHANRFSDESAIKRVSAYVWGTLLVLFVLYGLLVVKTLTHK